MNDRLNFEAESFEAQPEFDGEFQEFDTEQAESGWAGEFGRVPRFPSRSVQPVPRFSRAAGRSPRRPSRPWPVPPRKPTLWPPRPRIIHPWPPWAVVQEPYGVVSEPDSVEPAPTVSLDPKHTRWVQDCLNKILGLQLQLTGVVGPETRSAIRSFQKQQGLPANGIVGPDTQSALMDACNGREPQQRDSVSTPNSDGEELSMGFTGDLFEEEYSIPKAYTVTLIGHEPVRLESRAEANTLPRTPGIYFITDGLTLRYVGKAVKSIKSRFDDRFKTFRDFGIPEHIYFDWLKQNSVDVRSYTVTDTASKRPIRGDINLFGALEEYFRKMHNPERNKDAPRRVKFEKGSITVTYYGLGSSTLNRGEPICSKSEGPAILLANPQSTPGGWVWTSQAYFVPILSARPEAKRARAILVFTRARSSA